MTKNIFIFLICFSCGIVFQNCYTVIKNEQLHYSLYFPRGYRIDSALVGVWLRIETWMDYGDQIHKLEFRADGKLLYLPEFEKPMSQQIVGYYSTKDSVLLTKFNGQSAIESYVYSATNNSLIIKMPDPNATRPTTLLDHASSNIWFRSKQ